MMIRFLRAFAASGVAVCCAVAPLVLGAQSPAAPDPRDHVRALTSESFDGRAAGTEGERRAAEYLAAQLKRMGARPLPGRRDFFSTFDFTAGSRDGGSRVTVVPPAGGAGGDRVFSGGKDVVALSFSDSTEVSGDVVFAGYGIVVPESQNFGYDSYAGLDVKDKIALVLRYFPENADQSTRAILARYADLRYKAMAARQRGAIGLLVVTGPASPNAGETIPMTFDTAIAGSGISAASVSAPVAQSLLGDTPLRELQAALDGGNPHVAGVPTGRRARLAPSVVRQRRTGRNVVGYLPATTPVDGVARPWVAVGAHFDHLGRGAGGNSLAARDEIGRPHVGADDNASGTAAVLAIGETLSTRPRRRHLLLAFWSAEEIGLIGSARFLDGGLVKSTELAAYLNFDMVGRMVDNRLAVQATGTSTSWPTLLEQVNVAAGFDLAVQPDPFQPTDVSNFNQAGVPSLSFTTGAHTDYHKPSDTADKINYDDLARIASMATTIATRLMEAPEPPLFAKVEQSNQTASRTGLRVFTGTVPDYTSSEKGLLLGGVVGGGPAELAGLRKGDVIVEISGKTIANIYDYTYALELLKVGQPADVTYVRQGERRRTTLTPSARR